MCCELHPKLDIVTSGYTLVYYDEVLRIAFDDTLRYRGSLSEISFHHLITQVFRACRTLPKSKTYLATLGLDGSERI